MSTTIDLRDKKFIPQDINQVLNGKKIPTVLMWNRLEGRPRTHNFNKALKAEVRDSLWMLTKQWQMGEFKGDDAGSPVFAKIHIKTSCLDSYKAAGNESQSFEKDVPLETKAEQKKIPFIRAGKEMSLDIRLQMGRYWLKLLETKGLNFRIEFIAKYSFELPARDRSTDYIYAHKNVWQQYAAISGRCIDGYKLFQYIIEPGKAASDDIITTDPEKTELDNLGIQFKDWYTKMYYQPTDEQNNAWLPEKLEYQFECSGTADHEEKNLKAQEYYYGHLDWYAFDISQKKSNNEGPKKEIFTSTFIPTHVEFDGMPNTRWWKFEDSKTNLGAIKPSTTDMSLLLLMEFGLVFANDWFLVPFALPIGSLANIEGLTVKNNFGETIWVQPAELADSDKSQWSMFKLSSNTQNNTLLLAPSALKVHEGNSLEEIVLIRDEISNMVWGIETGIPSVTGNNDKGNEAGLRIRQYHEKIVTENPVVETPYSAKVSYLSMTNVPENWIPFVPVHLDNNNREIILQRASMLRIIEDDPDLPVKVKPLTSILREGLEDEPQPSPYYINEEEVPRTGVKVTQAFQRTRWINGEVYVWLGMKKKIGRGEGSSGLKFDQLNDVKTK